MSRDRQNDVLYNVVKENSDQYDIGRYILDKYREVFTNEEAKKVARLLMNRDGYSKEDIMAGKANQKIIEYVAYYLMKNASVDPVIEEKEEKKEIPLKTSKRKVGKQVVTLILAGVMSVSALTHTFSALKETYEDYKFTEEIDQNISYVINNNETKQSIVSKNTLMHGTNSKGAIISYDINGIANDVVSLLNSSPYLLDLLFSNIYSDLNHNKLKTMDEIISSIKEKMKDDDSLQEVYQKIQNIDIFLEYLLTSGLIDPSDKDYGKVITAIAEYKKVANKKTPLYSLDEKHQKVIEDFIREYNEERPEIYERYDTMVNDLVSDAGGRK